MKKKGQVGLGVIIITFIAILVGVILFQAIAQQAGTSTNTVAVANESVSAVGIVNTTTYYIDYRSITDVVIVNGSVPGAGDIVDAANYTVTNNVIDPSDGSLSVSIDPADGDYDGEIWSISGTAQPTTYVAESSARAVVGLIAIFFALAIAVIAITPTLRSGVLDMINR